MSGWRWAMMLVAHVAMAGCWEDKITKLGYRIGTDTQAPAYVMEVRINDLKGPIPPGPRQGGVGSFPRSYRGIDVAVPKNDPFSISVLWVEIITGRAYEAEALVSIHDLETISLGGSKLKAEVELLLLPGGEMIVVSDPLPKDGRIFTRDLQRVCGERRPKFDGKLTDEKALSEIPRLGDILGFADDPIDAPPCGGERE